MTTARDIMTDDVEFASPTDTVRDAARKMGDLDVGMLPVCGTDRRLVGTITDRDLALKVVAEGRDAGATKVDDVFTQGEVITIGADDPLDEALQTMERYAVRRLPVIDGDQVVGIVTQADIATNTEAEKTGKVVEGISEARPNN
jgi:CBS domain-containing protein